MKKRFLLMFLINIMIIMGGVVNAEEHYRNEELKEKIVECDGKVDITGVTFWDNLDVSELPRQLNLSDYLNFNTSVKIKVKVNSKKTQDFEYVSGEPVVKYKHKNRKLVKWKETGEIVTKKIPRDKITPSLPYITDSSGNVYYIDPSDFSSDSKYLVENGKIYRTVKCDGEIEITRTPLGDGIHHQTIKKCKKCGAEIENKKYKHDSNNTTCICGYEKEVPFDNSYYVSQAQAEYNKALSAQTRVKTALAKAEELARTNPSVQIYVDNIKLECVETVAGGVYKAYSGYTEAQNAKSKEEAETALRRSKEGAAWAEGEASKAERYLAEAKNHPGASTQPDEPIDPEGLYELTEVFKVISEENGKELTKNEFINFRITSAYSPIKAVHIGVKDKNGQDRNGSYFGNLVYDLVEDKSVVLNSEQDSNQKSFIFNKNGKVKLNTTKDVTLSLPASILNVGKNDVRIHVQVENNAEYTESGFKYTLKEEQIYETTSNSISISSSCLDSENILPFMKQEKLENIINLVTNVEDGEEILPETKVRIEITTKTKLDQKPLSTPKIEKIYIEDENLDKILGNLIYSDIKTLEQIENGYKLEFNPSIYLKGKEQRIKFIIKVVFNNGSTYSREYIYKYDEETKIDNNTPQTIIVNEPIIPHDYSKKCEKAHCGKKICSACGMHEGGECGGDHDSQTCSHCKKVYCSKCENHGNCSHDEKGKCEKGHCDKKVCSICGIHQGGECGGDHDSKTCSHCKKTYCSKCENHTSCPHDEKGKCEDAHCVAANKATYCSICNNHTHVGCNSDETCSKTNCLAKICSVCKKHECKGDKAPEVIQTNWDSVKVTCKNPNNLVTYEGVLGKSTNGQDIKRDSNLKFTITKPSDMKVELRYKSYTGLDKTQKLENSTVDLMVGTVITPDKGKYSVDVVFIAQNGEEKTATYYFFIER